MSFMNREKANLLAGKAEFNDLKKLQKYIINTIKRLAKQGEYCVSLNMYTDCAKQNKGFLATWLKLLNYNVEVDGDTLIISWR